MNNRIARSLILATIGGVLVLALRPTRSEAIVHTIAKCVNALAECKGPGLRKKAAEHRAKKTAKKMKEKKSLCSKVKKLLQCCHADGCDCGECCGGCGECGCGGCGCGGEGNDMFYEPVDGNVVDLDEVVYEP